MRNIKNLPVFHGFYSKEEDELLGHTLCEVRLGAIFAKAKVTFICEQRDLSKYKDIIKKYEYKGEIIRYLEINKKAML